jgi:hypothetical protein
LLWCLWLLTTEKCGAWQVLNQPQLSHGTNAIYAADAVAAAEVAPEAGAAAGGGFQLLTITSACKFTFLVIMCHRPPVCFVAAGAAAEVAPGAGTAAGGRGLSTADIWLARASFCL